MSLSDIGKDASLAESTLRIADIFSVALSESNGLAELINQKNADFHAYLKKQGDPKKVSNADYLPSILSSLLQVEAGYEKVTEKSVKKALDGVDLDNIDDVTAALMNLGNEGAKTGSKLSSAFAGLKIVGGKALSSVIGLLSNPATWAVAAAGAVVLATYANSFGVLSQKAEEANTAYQETVSELDTMKNQLETNQAQIKELESSDSKASKEKIENLKQENILLASQIKLQEQEAEQARKTAAEAANKALTTKNIGKVNEYDGLNGMYMYGDAIDRYAWQVDALAKLKSSYSDSLSDLQYMEDNGYDPNGHAYKTKAQEAETLHEKIVSLEASMVESEAQITSLWGSIYGDSEYSGTQARILEVMPDIESKASTLSENMQTISDTFRSTLSGENMNTEDLEKAMEKTDSWLSDLTEDEQQIVFDLFMDESNAINSLQDLQAAYAEYQKAMTGTSSAFPVDIESERGGIDALNSAISESSAATGLAAATTQTLIDRYKDLDGFDA